MELSEVIKQFSYRHVRLVYNRLASIVVFPSVEHISTYDSVFDKLWGQCGPREEVRQVFLSNTGDKLSRGIVIKLTAIGNGDADEIINGKQKVKWPMDSSEYFPRLTFDNIEHRDFAILFSLIPTGALQKVASKNGITISDVCDSASHRCVTSGNKNTTRQALIKKMTEELSSPVSLSHQSFCPQCNIDIASWARGYCLSCGKELPQIDCPNCKSTNSPQAKFCMGCGEERQRHKIKAASKQGCNSMASETICWCTHEKSDHESDSPRATPLCHSCLGDSKVVKVSPRTGRVTTEAQHPFETRTHCWCGHDRSSHRLDTNNESLCQKCQHDYLRGIPWSEDMAPKHLRNQMRWVEEKRRIFGPSYGPAPLDFSGPIQRYMGRFQAHEFSHDPYVAKDILNSTYESDLGCGEER